MIDIDQEVNWGSCRLHPEQLKRDICMEELAELQQAISKVTRDKFYNGYSAKEYHDLSTRMPSQEDTNEHIHKINEIEEMADVYLILDYLKVLDGITDYDIQRWIDYKQERQMKRDLKTINNLEGYVSEDVEDYEEYLRKKLQGDNESN